MGPNKTGEAVIRGDVAELGEKQQYSKVFNLADDVIGDSDPAPVKLTLYNEKFVVVVETILNAVVEAA